MTNSLTENSTVTLNDAKFFYLAPNVGTSFASCDLPDGNTLRRDGLDLMETKITVHDNKLRKFGRPIQLLGTVLFGVWYCVYLSFAPEHLAHRHNSMWDVGVYMTAFSVLLGPAIFAIIGEIVGGRGIEREEWHYRTPLIASQAFNCLPYLTANQQAAAEDLRDALVAYNADDTTYPELHKISLRIIKTSHR